jgi:hypothetical protein
MSEINLEWALNDPADPMPLLVIPPLSGAEDPNSKKLAIGRIPS